MPGIGIGIGLDRGSREAPWMPAQLGTDLIELIDLSVLGPDGNPSGVTLDNGKVSVVSSLKAGSTNTFVQSNGALQPTLNPYAANSCFSLLFSGQQALQSSTNITLTSWLIVTVVRAFSGGNVIYEHSANAAASSGIYAFTNTTGYAATRSGGVYSTYTPSFPIDSTWRILEHEFNGTHASHKITYNGVLQSLTNQFTSDPGTSSYSAQWNIGARNATSSFLQGEIAFQAICKFLTSTDPKRLALRAYCSRTFGIAA